MDFLHLVAKWKMSTSSRSLDEVVLHMYSVACVCHINIVLHLNCSLLSIVCRYYINTWVILSLKYLNSHIEYKATKLTSKIVMEKVGKHKINLSHKNSNENR